MTFPRIMAAAATLAVSISGLLATSANAQIYQPYSDGYARRSYPADARRRDTVPDFDALDDDEPVRPYGAPYGGTALPPPGPVYSDEPRYARPPGPPVYSDRPAPQGPVLSPDDPRYGRPAGPPPVIYSDRPGGPPPGYPDRGDERYSRAPAPYAYPNDDSRPRPPEVIGAPAQTGSVQQAPGAAPPNDGRPMLLAALPPDEQPEMGAPVQLPPHLRRQEVAFNTKEPAGTIVVDTSNTYLYYVVGGGRAVRYGIRVGRDGFRWSGVQKVTRKTEWPDWHPPAEMIERQPYLPRFMAGGEGNPLGARAMYLGNTVYRIHGTNQPSTIGKTVSSGCFGLLNEDVMDLFERVKVGTRVVVMPGNPQSAPDGIASAAQASATASAVPLPIGGAQGGPVPGTSPTIVPPLPAPVTVR